MSGVGIDARSPRGTSVAGVAGWLTLAAAPVFAVMAVLTAAHDGGPADILCAAAHDASPLGGMTVMYALMAVFHAPPWIRMMSIGGEKQARW